MELNELPDELLLKIFSYLSLGSLSDVSYLTLICKNWRRILWSKEFLRLIGSFKYQSRFLIHRCFINKNLEQFLLPKSFEFDLFATIPYFTIDGGLSTVKEDIENCPLINMTISMWCRTINSTILDGTILLLWHFHLGYVGLYRDGLHQDCALIKCTYTKQHQLRTSFHLKRNEWYHVAIVIKEKNLQLYINGNRIGDWPLEENINKQNLFIAPYSSIWFASHCGAHPWHGSLFDICLWKRCLEPYELRAIAQTRIPVEDINFISQLQL